MEATSPPSPCAPGGNWERSQGGQCSLTSPLLCFTIRWHPEARRALGGEEPEWSALPLPPYTMCHVPLVLALKPQAEQSP